MRILGSFLVLLALLSSPAGAVTKCKATPARDGTIEVTAIGITGTPRWGVRHGDEDTPLDGIASCVQSGRARRCALAPVGAPERTALPAGCTIYLRDDGPTDCSVWVKRCFPSSEPLPCPVLPADNIWNRDISTMPVHAMSATWIDSIGAGDPLHPDFGAGPYHGKTLGIPYVVIGATQPLVPITFEYFDESEPGPYPIPPNVPVEGGGSKPSVGRGDAHVLLVQEGTCQLWEVFAARTKRKGASWTAGSGAIYDLGSNALRPDGWTSADAAGLPILPGLLRYDEIVAGEVTHAIRFTTDRTQRAYVWPARHYASSSTDPALPPMGIRVRLKATFDVSTYSPTNQIILNGMKRYGMLLADNGAPWFISGAPDRRWDDEDLHALTTLHGNDFEVVDTSSLMIDPDSGQALP
ncbi:MAG TPA: hypothetical protein VGR62_03500 [Candidatus Binatia bacterium]|jgi:hypothetical protein|nr:hypothetical protein [Candidatus Binatia bacterium]